MCISDFANHVRTTGAACACLAGLVLYFCASPSLQAQAPGSSLDEMERQAFVAAADAVAASVVRIQTIGGLESVNGVRTGAQACTGLIVGEDGLIATAAFNIAHRPTSILVRLPDGTAKPAELVATDHVNKIALLKVEADGNLPLPAFADKEDFRVGQWAIALGRVYSPDAPNVSVGIVSATDRIWGKALQVDAACSAANYGGPVVDIQGRVMGLVVPLSPDADDVTSGVEWYDSGIGFAISSDSLLSAVSKLSQGDDLLHGLSGMRFNPKTIHTAEPRILSLFPASPADEAGIKAKDLVLSIDGRPIVRAADVRTSLGPKFAGETIHIVVDREGAQHAFDITLAEELLPFAHGFLGVLPMRRPDANETPGVVVRHVFNDSPAAQLGIQPGDRIVRVAGEAVTDGASLRKAVGDLGPEAGTTLAWVSAEGQQTEQPVTLAKLPDELPDGDFPNALTDEAKNGAVKTGLTEIALPDVENKVWAYVPESASDGRPLGMLLTLHSPNQYDHEATLALWKDICETYALMLVMPKATGEQWQSTDADLLLQVANQAMADYPIDPTRVAVHGRLASGSLAILLAMRPASPFTGVATVDGPAMGRPNENAPDRRLAFFIAHSDAMPGQRSAAMIEPLRKMHYPTGAIELGAAPRRLNAEERRRLARWIDSLDRI